MKVSQIRELLVNYSKIVRCSDQPEKAVALEDFSKILAPVDKRTIAHVLKKLTEAKG